MRIPFTLIRREHYQQLLLDKQSLEKNITDATGFIKAIELGELDSSMFLASHDDSTLFQALLSMRNQMKTIEEKERERNWSTEGLAKFVEILRASNDTIDALYNNILSNLVKYLNANQGGLFVINEEDESEPFIELVACYAYNRKKYLEKKLAFGEGLVGQCVLEKDKIHMTDIPKEYVSITSGLGDATPGSLILIPLKVNDHVYGVVEIASFKPFLPHQIEFIEKLGESIASTISNAKIGHKTHRLLKESQMKEEQLRSQEEEMRQNMEELSATQEEIQRVLKEVQGKENYLSELLNASSDSIFTFDKEYRVISFNKTFSSGLEAMGIQLDKGFEILQLFQDQDKAKHKAYYNRVLSGESFQVTDKTVINNVASYYAVSYSPLRNEHGIVTAAAVFAKDVTEMMLAKEKSEDMLREAQQQAEELRAQEEEMRQNLEELQTIQEELARKNAEIEEIRMIEKARADQQIEAQKAVMLKTVEKFRNSETLFMGKIEALEKELMALKQSQNENAA